MVVEAATSRIQGTLVYAREHNPTVVVAHIHMGARCENQVEGCWKKSQIIN